MKTRGSLPYAWLAWKILFFKGNPTLQKFSVATAIGAIAVGVASLLITIGVIDGFHREIKGRILGLSPHVFVRLKATGATIAQESDQINPALSSLGVLASSPFAIGQAMIRSASGTMGMVVKAVDPEKETSVTKIKDLLIRGDWLSNPESQRAGSGVKGKPVPVLLGNEAARSLGVLPGSVVTLMTSPGSDSLAGLPKMRPAVVTGIFQSGYYEYDSTLAYIPLERADELWKTAGGESAAIYWVGMTGDDPDQAAALAKDVAGRILSNQNVFQVLSWGDMNKSLFSALKLEKLMLTLVLSLIIFIASITVASNLVMLAAQKTKMIGALRSLGLGRQDIGRLMFSIGGTLGALGVMGGLALAGPVVLLLKKTDLVKLPAEIYMLERLPIHLEPMSIISVAVFAWLVSLLASVLPAYRTARLDVSQVLRYG